MYIILVKFIQYLPSKSRDQCPRMILELPTCCEKYEAMSLTSSTAGAYGILMLWKLFVESVGFFLHPSIDVYCPVMHTQWASICDGLY